jgi:O-antigen ligase
MPNRYNKNDRYLPINNINCYWKPVMPINQQFNIVYYILELATYIYLFYAIFAVQLGISINLLGIGILSSCAILALFLMISDYRPILILILICLTSGLFLVIQMEVFQVAWDQGGVKALLTWVLLSVVFYAQIHRPGFLKRLGIVMLIISVLLMPSIILEKARVPGEIVRAKAVEGTSLNNANALGALLGFTALVFWLWGFRQARMVRRWGLWGISVIIFLLMGLTVSRGALLAVLIGLVLSFRGVSLRHRISAMVMLTILSYVVLFIPFIAQLVGDFQARALEETGRFLIWPAAWEQIVQSPWLGHGAEHEIYLPSLGVYRSAHNPFLYLWVSSGILPVIFLAILWVCALRKANRWDPKIDKAGIDPLPLLGYAITMSMSSNFHFVSVWAVVAVCYSTIGDNVRIGREVIAARLMALKPARKLSGHPVTPI